MIAQGLSGSGFLVEGELGGVLLGVESDGRRGRVLRMERVLDTVDPFLHLATKSKPAPDTVQCRESQVWNGSACIDRCDADMRWDGTRCTRRCSGDQRWDGSTCVDPCPEGKRWDGRRCVNICSSGEHWDGTDCIRNGYPSGYGLVQCGCHGFATAGATRPNKRCESGYEVAEPCAGWCPAGGSPWGVVCQ
jgi:hypothetical protein